MSKKINEVKEHDGCVDCKYEYESCNLDPCYSCKQNHHQPNSKPDLWEEDIKEIEEPVREIPNPIRPSHYKSCSIECIDAMILTFGTDAVAEFCLINAFKYIWRHKDKNGIEDLNKAMWYINKAEELKHDDTKKLYTLRRLTEVLKGEYDGQKKLEFILQGK